MAVPQLPPKPSIVLRIAFVGSRNLSANTMPLQGSLENVFDLILAQMAGIAKEQAALDTKERFYSESKPVVRLVTGLAEGADSLAWTAMRSKQSEEVQIELAAVLGADIPSYRAYREDAHKAVFDEMLQQCSYVLPLDGHYIPEDAGKPYRARLYRSQAIVLLRHADILVAMADPQTDSRPGGTMETIAYALHAGQPVVFIHSATGEISLVETANDLSNITENKELLRDIQPMASWNEQLKEWVKTIAGGPDIRTGSTADIQLLDEFFNETSKPRYTSKGERIPSIREKCWRLFEHLFKARSIQIGQDQQTGQFGEYRRRATRFNYHYAGLYRGAFLINYALAALAVAVAAICLLLLKYEASHIPTSDRVEHHVGGHVPSPYTVVLIVLGCLKLVFLLLIVINSRQAHKGKWNDKAVGYRYLAERLRNMLYLPYLGSYRPPAATPPQYSGSFQVRQSQADWLFNAIIRSVSPANSATETAIAAGSKKISVKVIILKPAKELVTIVKDNWIKNQIDYHNRNNKLMESMNHRMEKAGVFLNVAVMILVFIDILLLLNLITDVFPGITQMLHAHAVWILFCAAVFPVMVASLNSIRFQSECERLAERSAIVKIFLDGRPERPGGRMQEAENLGARINKAAMGKSPDPGSWIVDTMLLGESVAQDLTREVSEWGMLYAKELAEP
jgi:nucleoside 2-deoxyribosyltransferase